MVMILVPALLYFPQRNCQSSIWKKASGNGGKQVVSSVPGIYANSTTKAGVYQRGPTGMFTSCAGLLSGYSLSIDGAMNIFAGGTYLGNIASGSLYYVNSPQFTDSLQITSTGIADSSTCYNGGSGLSTGFFPWLS